MTATIAKPAEVAELCSVEITDLAGMVKRLGETAWRAENEIKENNFAIFTQTEHVVFRFITDGQDHTVSHANTNWAVWAPHLMPVMAQAIEPYKILNPIFPKVMLARLAAGGTIATHRDTARSNFFTHKIHVPLLTNPQAFTITQRDHRSHLEAGKAYEINNLGPHGAVNEGPTPRVHLIFEVFDATA